MFKINSLNKKNNDLDCLLSFSFNSPGRLIKPTQVYDEILELLKILNEIKPKIVVEIGTAGGGTLFLLSHVAYRDAIIISLDLPDGYPTWEILLYRLFALPNQKIHLIRADSHSQSTLERVQSILNGKEVDLLFIDGDHTYEGVKKDFEMYSSLVKNGGIIAFHDIVSGPEENVGGVPEFWREIRDRYEVKEIVKDRDQGGYGIGLIHKTSSKEDEV